MRKNDQVLRQKDPIKFQRFTHPFSYSFEIGEENFNGTVSTMTSLKTYYFCKRES